MHSKAERVILACPNFQAASRNPRGPKGELVSIHYDVAMENDLCPGLADHLVPVDIVRKYVPSFDSEVAKEALVRAMGLAMGAGPPRDEDPQGEAKVSHPVPPAFAET